MLPDVLPDALFGNPEAPKPCAVTGWRADLFAISPVKPPMTKMTENPPRIRL